jgi:hypothetical protein
VRVGGGGGICLRPYFKGVWWVCGGNLVRVCYGNFTFGWVLG